jgi:hypothetical protein
LPAQIWGGFMRVALKGAAASVIPRSTPAAPLDFAVDNVDGMNVPDTEWNFEGPRPETAPPPPQRRERRRGLLDWLFGGDDDDDDDDDSGRQQRSRNSRELAPRAVQEGDGHWTRVPRAQRPNPPPSDAAVPPPDTPPPD